MQSNMVSVQSIRDEVVRVNRIDDAIGVGFGSCCEDDNLVEFGHLGEEFSHEGSLVDYGLFLVVVDEGLVEVHHKTELFAGGW